MIRQAMTILVADDDADDRALTREVFDAARVANRLDFVGDGSNSFVTKPVSFKALLDVVQTLRRYWLEIVDLPPPLPEP